MHVLVKLALVLTLVASFHSAARADEIIDQIEEGLQLYEKGSYSEAVTTLNFAVGQIQQKQAAGLKNVFPEPLAGWQAEESKGEFAPAAFMGGGISASRRYYVENQDKSVNIEIVTDSPLLQSVMLFFTNPAFFASQPDAKLVKIQGQKAIQKFTREDREGEISIVVGSRMLVSIKGQAMDNPDDLLAYANAIDYKALEKFLEH
ncbi:MAG: hypothetical protein RBS57_12800 [Desulforhabdus sp.]|nr:hypothetical protein [Desulforhabdus sp.]